jgi:hypothetical protein
MKLTELFNSIPKKIKVEHDNKNAYVASAIINDKPLQVNCYRMHYEHVWEIEFTQNGVHMMSGNGGEFQIFSFVKSCIETASKKHPEVTQFHCSADKARISLYIKLLKKIPGWSLKAPDIDGRASYSLYLVKDN